MESKLDLRVALKTGASQHRSINVLELDPAFPKKRADFSVLMALLRKCRGELIF
jgi:hypothetical protein